MAFQPETCLHLCAALLLSYCAIVDVRSRKIPNMVWLVAIIGMLPMRVLLQLMGSVDLLPSIAWGLGFTASSFLMWMLRLIGGADAKGIMVLAWMLPPIALVYGQQVHLLLWAMPLALMGMLAWQPISKGPVPFYAFLAPIFISIQAIHLIW